jgi:hypothetical protein
MKGKDRRFQIGVYVSGSTIETIDKYVMEHQGAKWGQYSRSDFVNEALEKYMKELGLIGGDDDEQKQG